MAGMEKNGNHLPDTQTKWSGNETGDGVQVTIPMVRQAGGEGNGCRGSQHGRTQSEQSERQGDVGRNLQGTSKGRGQEEAGNNIGGSGKICAERL